jgi:hypothetical protein
LRLSSHQVTTDGEEEDPARPVPESVVAAALRTEYGREGRRVPRKERIDKSNHEASGHRECAVRHLLARDVQ